MDPKAEQFYRRYLQAQTEAQGLLCLYNAFFVLYGRDSFQKMASLSGVSADTIRKAVETCQEDFEGERIVLPNNSILRMKEFLESL